HECVRAEVLPAHDHRLREHPRRAQGDVRRLLPDGPVARAHLQGHAGRSFPRSRVAEVPARERRQGVQPVTSTRFPFPVPFGWFCVGFPDDIATSEAKPLYYWERHLVAWRDGDGELHVMDAFCPHLGAHLGHGGTVDGCELVCPFHGWQYDTEG